MKMDVIRSIEGGEKEASVARRLNLNESSIRTTAVAIKASVKSFDSGDPSSRHTVTLCFSEGKYLVVY